MRYSVACISLLHGLAAAIPPAVYPNLKIIWQDTFGGAAGSGPSDKWTIALDLHNNNEVEVYTDSNNNLQISGGDTIQFVPRKTASGGWTSARIEARDPFTPEPGKLTRVEASLRTGTNPQQSKQGVWPAFWLLGDSIRHGTEWPQCGEIDIFEQVDGVMTGYGTAHCGAYPGGVCNEPLGKGASTGIPDNEFHTWSVVIDRTAADWTQESITWMLDGAVFNSLTGGQLGDQAVWSTLAHSPLFVILNLAIGGDWPGPPNADTLDGYGSMLEVAYVAVYSS